MSEEDKEYYTAVAHEIVQRISNCADNVAQMARQTPMAVKPLDVLICVNVADTQVIQLCFAKSKALTGWFKSVAMEGKQIKDRELDTIREALNGKELAAD